MPVHRHEIVSVIKRNGCKIFEVKKEVTVQIFKKDQDCGYHDDGNDWWGKPDADFSFQYMSIDSLYPINYFGNNIGHPDQPMAEDLVSYMFEKYEEIFGCSFCSVIELGTGGGEITSVLHRKGVDVLAVEGTTAGAERLQKQGIPVQKIIISNLKFLDKLNRKFDMAMCTEVAEHIEPFFASKIVDNCISHSDVVWFSAADRNRRAHYHHSNEQSIEVWDNLFAHMGHSFFIALDGRHGRASRIYLSESIGRKIANAECF